MTRVYLGVHICRTHNATCTPAALLTRVRAAGGVDGLSYELLEFVDVDIRRISPSCF